MKQLLSLILLISLLGCGSSGMAGGAEDVNTFVLTGICVSASGKSVSEAKVQLIPSDYIAGESDLSELITVESDIDGEFSVEARHSNYSIVITSKDSSAHYMQFNIDNDSAAVFRVDTLKPSGLMRFSLPDRYEESADIVIPGTAYRYPITDLIIDTNNGILSTEINLPENDYPEIVYNSGDTKTDLSEDEIFEVGSNDTTDGTLREVWVHMIDTLPVVEGIVTTMFSNNTNSLWIGTESGGLFHAIEYYSDGQKSLWELRKYHDINSSVILDSIVAIDGCGESIVIASVDGIILFDGQKFNNITKNNPVVEALAINDVTLLSDGTVVAALSTGTAFYSEGKWKLISYIENAPFSSVNTVHGYSRDRVFGSDPFGVFSVNIEKATCSYINKDALTVSDMVVTEKSIHLATDHGVVSLVNGAPFYAAAASGVSIRSIAGTDSVMWAGSAADERIYALRKHSSRFEYYNCPLKDTDIIAGVAFCKGTAFMATAAGKLISVQYKITNN